MEAVTLVKISFVPGKQEIQESVPPPEQSKNFIPKWYKDIPGKQDLINVKKCIPFLDSMSHGYIQKTWADIHVEKSSDGITVSCNDTVCLFSVRETSDIPTGDQYYDFQLIWQRPWSPVLPDGYSGLVVHPLNRLDLPFLTLSGIVDFDKSIHAPVGNIPFYIKRGFVGVIPTGTPMFQIIPIKREEWTSEVTAYSESFWDEKVEERKGISDFYKKKLWQKKSFQDTTTK